MVLCRTTRATAVVELVMNEWMNECVSDATRGSQDYGEIAVAYRPSHADATYDMKYGVRAIAGGGRSSARETIGRVAAGAIAKKVLKEIAGTEILAYVSQVKDVVAGTSPRTRSFARSLARL